MSSGSRTPMKLTELRQEQPGIFDQLMHYEAALERHFRDMQVRHHLRLCIVVFLLHVF